MAENLIPKIFRSRRKTISLEVLPDATLIVKAPMFVPNFFINQFIKKNQKWIDKKLSQVNKYHVKKKLKYNNGNSIFFLGKSYTLLYTENTKIELKNDYLLIPIAVKFRAEKELVSWYLAQARLIITKQVEHFALQMNAKYTAIKFSDTKSQWGRCTHDNKLQFSWRLIKAPLLVINYVVVHELAHTFEKNHSRAFWSKVRLYNPSYRQQIKYLRDNGHSLKD